MTGKLLFILNVESFRIQVYDDDGKKGPDAKDQLIGSGFFSLKELEAGSIVNTQLPLTDGKRSKTPGFLVVRSYKEHQTGGRQQTQPGVGYPAQPNAGYGGYPRQAGPAAGYIWKYFLIKQIGF